MAIPALDSLMLQTLKFKASLDHPARVGEAGKRREERMCPVHNAEVRWLYIRVIHHTLQIVRRDFKCSHHKEMMDVWGDGFANCPIILQCTLILKHHIVSHKYSQLSWVNHFKDGFYLWNRVRMPTMGFVLNVAKGELVEVQVQVQMRSGYSDGYDNWMLIGKQGDELEPLQPVLLGFKLESFPSGTEKRPTEMESNFTAEKSTRTKSREKINLNNSKTHLSTRNCMFLGVATEQILGRHGHSGASSLPDRELLTLLPECWGSNPGFGAC